MKKAIIQERSSCAGTARPPVGVEVSGLSKNFGTQRVLKDISLTVKPGEIFTIMGPSGSGKSVLLRQIAGLDQPTKGTARINGLDPADPDTRDRFAIALVFQAGALFNSISVYDNLALYLLEHRLCPKKEMRDRVMRALKILSLENAVKKFPSELSGGMKKRVAIARALVMEPQLLLYDEPTSELDPVMSATITEIIATLKTEFNVTSIVVSHDRDLALTISDRVALLMKGELRALCSPAELRKVEDPAVKDFLNPTIDLKKPRYQQLESS
ncbi:ABC transporter ATP-binding protein [Nibricoccus aquaticus]|uniref:ABC transporter ATP-binding protein n=1 Tax=Nibricoccus aquaticus TaxID=2576891 RepID=A0A290Q4M3_9BACT|nr:ATP-binding cassette domain-containing protein [Nibricoccus aquaticus]ATC63635.1 ABC transporter ATP-binding protein [Nibricoccus aquaticus]